MLKRTPLRKISDKQSLILKAEAKLTQRLLQSQNGLCGSCGQKPDWRGLSKHEKVFRSHGGNPLDESNCILLCGRCHSEIHKIWEEHK